MGSRKCLWIFWVLMAFITGTYCALSLVTFSNVYRTYKKADNDESLRAILAAAFFGSVLVFMYAFVSFCTLLGKSVFRSGAGFSYGFITSSSIHMALTSLLCALVMHGFQDEIEQEIETNEEIEWGGIDTAVFKSAFAMAYVATAIYLLWFLILVFDKGAVQKQAKPAAQDTEKMIEEGKA